MTSIARDLRMSPQARKVLAHLEQFGTISPLEAFGVFGITRLAARIKEIRDAGHLVNTTMHKDASGKPYGRYTMAQRYCPYAGDLNSYAGAA